MGWIDQLARVKHPDGRELIGASFRGVPFFVEASTRSGGRRPSRKQFVEGDIPSVVDLGKAANDFSLEGYVLGDDYMIHRDALWDALQEVAGPGNLVHPYYGRNIRVQCGPVEVRETKDNGGIATFSIDFMHAPKASSARVTVNLNGVVHDASVAVKLSNGAQLAEDLITVGQPAFALQSLSDELTTVSESLNAKLSVVALVTQELAKMNQILVEIGLQATTLIRTPEAMLDALLSAIEVLVETVETVPLGVVEALLATFETTGTATAIGSTGTRDQERENQVTLSSGLRIVLLSEACRIVTGVSFDSIEEATATRDDIVAAIDTIAETVGDQTYPDLVSLRSSILNAIPGDSELSRVVITEQFVDVPSLILSYQAYGSTANELALVARNKPRHPGFMSGSIKVLTDA